MFFRTVFIITHAYIINNTRADFYAIFMLYFLQLCVILPLLFWWISFMYFLQHLAGCIVAFTFFKFEALEDLRFYY